MLRRYHLWSIGCQMNRADADRLAEALQTRGYQGCDRPEDADLVVLNTCVVRQSAEDKVAGRLDSLRALKRRRDGDGEPALLVMGCLVGDVAALRERYPHVDAFFVPSDIDGVLDHVARWEAERGWALVTQAAGLGPARVTELVPVSQGCDHRCTYCIVTLRRGPQRSRALRDIVADVRTLVQRGAREVTLLGQNVDAYGRDLNARPDLADVLLAVHEIPALWRIRFLTSHPRDLSERIIDAVAESPKVCPSWELPVQAGDDQVLRRMGRGYTVSRYLELVESIRRAAPESALNTDVIVGFPGESAAQFERTLALLERVRFDVVHVAAYSPRAGTPAASWPDDVSPEEKERRRAAVEGLQTRIAAEINQAYLGLEVEVLVDGRRRGRWRGRTRGNRLVFFDAPDDWLGRLAAVRITWAGPWSLIGEAPRALR